MEEQIVQQYQQVTPWIFGVCSMLIRRKDGSCFFAEMKLPGEAWLEFKIVNDRIEQTATFRPLGLAGRIYWYSVYPFHGYIFKGMLKKLCIQRY